MSTENSNVNVNYTGSITHDEGLDLASALEELKREKVESDSVKAKDAASLSDLITMTEAPVKETPKKTPLELEKERREREGSGLILSKSEIEENSRKPLKDFVNNERRESEFKKYNEDMDSLIDAAKNDITVVRHPINQFEMVEFMEEVERVSNHLKNGEDIGETRYVVKKEDKKDEEKVEDSTEKLSEEDVKKLEERKEIIEIIIDKTNLGFENIEFSDEEKEKIKHATEIKLKEVETLDLSSIRVVRPTKSFIETIEESTPSLSSTMVSLPGSRYRVQMKGLSYGQLGDIVLTDQTKNFDRIHRQYSIIFNSMGTPNIGRFENFEDFLRNTAFTDMDLLLYGLIVSTFPEIETIPLSCKRCGTNFNFEYSPRTLLDLENCSDAFLTNLKNVTECVAEDAVKFNEGSFLKKRKLLKLPYSGYIVEIGLASAYDYLYSMVDIFFGDSFKDQHPEDVNGTLQFNTAFITMIRSVYTPNVDGTYTQYTDVEDIIQALYRIKIDEFPMISNIVGKYVDEYTPQFSFKNVTCPSCGIITPRVGADLNDMVFRKYQQLLSTEVNVENIM